MQEVSLSSAMVQAKCPRCRKGNLFNVSVFSFFKLTEINGKCGKCGATITPEPDFFYGAMYISYAFSVALMVTVFVVLNFFFEKAPVSSYVLTVLVGNILLMPLMLRYSKVLYLYGMSKLKYDPKALEE